MKRFAIDVVILPPDNVTELAIEHNRTLLANNPHKLVLGKNRNLPHISLLMGCLAEDKLEDAIALLHSLIARHHILELSISGIQTDKSILSFDIARSKELIALHEEVVTSFNSLLTHDANEDDVDDPPPIEKSSLDWINRFIPHSCFNNYWPHITIGFGHDNIKFEPVAFQASRLAICHLGNHCTCTRILAEVSLFHG
jgi:hypothetical protein